MCQRQLKSCPYCGGNPVLRNVGDSHQYLMYKCFNCGKTPVSPNETRLTPLGAMAIWNTRCTELEYRRAEDE